MDPPVGRAHDNAVLLSAKQTQPWQVTVSGWPVVWTDLAAPSHLVSYLDSFLSSQAVLPPPKFCFAVLSKPLAKKKEEEA